MQRFTGASQLGYSASADPLHSEIEGQPWVYITKDAETAAKPAGQRPRQTVV